MDINKRIKEIRKFLGMTQAKFAEAISISNGYIADIELGNRKVNDRLIKLISLTFNTNENWIKTGDGNMFKNEKNQKSEIALSTFKELSPDFQDYVILQIEQLLKIQKKDE